MIAKEIMEITLKFVMDILDIQNLNKTMMPQINYLMGAINLGILK
jgi:hypothetical protein